jgi:hypothetical protein
MPCPRPYEVFASRSQIRRTALNATVIASVNYGHVIWQAPQLDLWVARNQRVVWWATDLHLAGSVHSYPIRSDPFDLDGIHSCQRIWSGSWLIDSRNDDSIPLNVLDGKFAHFLIIVGQYLHLVKQRVTWHTISFQGVLIRRCFSKVTQKGSWYCFLNNAAVDSSNHWDYRPRSAHNAHYLPPHTFTPQGYPPPKVKRDYVKQKALLQMTAGRI